MSSVSPPPPASPPTVAPAQRRHVDEQICRTRRALKFNDFLTGVLTLVVGVLAYLLTFSVLDHWVIPGGWSDGARTVLFGLLIVGAAWYSWRSFWPLLSRPINPAYAAQVIERSSPTLKNSLLNFLLLKNRRQQISEKVYEAIEQQADQRLSEAKIESVVDHTALLRLGYLLLAVVALCAFYRILSPKNLTDSVGRILLPWADIAAPSRVRILNITPGDTELARGESLEVAVELEGFTEDDVIQVHYSTLDGQIEDQTSPLTGDAASYRFEGSVPGRFGGGELGGVQQNLEYWIEAGDARSPRYQVTVFARPTLVVDKLRYNYPDYTGLPSREVRGTGDIRAIEGTKVSVYAQANHNIASANVDFEADGRNDVAMQHEEREATATFKLELEDDRRTPKHTSYVLRYKTTEGRVSTLPPRYEIDATPDYAPEVRLLKPADESGELIEELTVALDEEFVIEVEARDPDFALAKVTLTGKVGEKEALHAELLTKEHTGKYVGHFSSTPRELDLQEDDVLEYWAIAADNRQPDPNTAETEHLRIRVIGKPQFDNQQGEGERQQGEGGGPGEQGDQGEAGEGQQGESASGDPASEGGEQGESASAGGEGQESTEGEQQGAGGEGSNEGEQQGESPDSQGEGTNEQGEGEGNEQTESTGEPASAGGEPGEQGGQPQEKVSAEGDDDPEAFERIADHFAEKDANSQGEPQEGEGESGESQDSQTQPGDAASADGEKEADTEHEAGTEGEPQQGEQSTGEQKADTESEGTEGAPNPQRPKESPDNEGTPGEPASAGGETSPEQGDPGAGQQPGEQEGTPDAGERTPTDKTQQQQGESENESPEPSGQAGHEKESDSQGDQDGDKSGGGAEGAGQQADSEGTGTAGENTAADEGGSRSQQPGEGEQSNQPGEPAGESASADGEPSKDQPGGGTEQADDPQGQQPGGEEQASGDQPGEPSGEPASAGGEQGQESQSSPNSSAGNQQPGGGDVGTQGKSTPPPPDGDVPGDEANLEFARKKTDLVLDRLEDQLKKKDVDRDLLEKLGWSPDELQRFVDRWRKLEAAAAQPGAEGDDARAELDEALRSLGLDPNRPTGFRSRTIQDKLRELKDAYRGQTPLEYAEEVRAYIKGTAKAADDE